MYAVIETGGKQYRVSPGDTLGVEKLEPAGDQVVFDQVLLVVDDQGQSRVGTPLVKGATVSADVLGDKLGKKIRGLKYKSKSNYRVHFGHRQRHTMVRITQIEG
ncbi:MAG: 50S ribosomal protein L21 [Sulfobacillus sp.]